VPDETPNGSAAVPEVDFDELSAAPESSAAPAAGVRGGPDPGADAPEPDEGEVDLPAVLAQRDEYLALAKRVQADFENFRKRTLKQQQEVAASGAARLVESLLPVLDACDNAIIHGASDVAPIYKSLFETLTKAGLEVVPTDGVPFDPNVHEAVLHEPGDGGEPHIVDVLRTGYLWQGKVLRAAMVKVKD
jgi:molecular chaperone GrpE